jgi:hypothetical protein
MTTRLTAAIAAGALAVGILTGAAGAVVVGNATTNTALDRHSVQMGSMMGVTGSSAMGSMMGMMGGPSGMGPNSGLHQAHHPGGE